MIYNCRNRSTTRRKMKWKDEDTNKDENWAKIRETRKKSRHRLLVRKRGEDKGSNSLFLLKPSSVHLRLPSLYISLSLPSLFLSWARFSEQVRWAAITPDLHRGNRDLGRTGILDDQADPESDAFAGIQLGTWPEMEEARTARQHLPRRRRRRSSGNSLRCLASGPPEKKFRKVCPSVFFNLF